MVFRAAVQLSQNSFVNRSTKHIATVAPTTEKLASANCPRKKRISFIKSLDFTQKLHLG